MPISPEQASTALDQIADTQSSSRKLYGYQRGAPHLIVWGVLWMTAFGLTTVFPAHAAIIWGIIVPLGVGAGIILDRRRDDETTPRDWRYAFAAIAFAVFFYAAFAVMKPHSANQTGAFICLVVALVYVLMGLWFGFRYILGGVAIALLTLTGFFLLPSYFSLWMAFVGGGALILTGLWLRRP